MKATKIIIMVIVIPSLWGVGESWGLVTSVLEDFDTISVWGWGEVGLVFSVLEDFDTFALRGWLEVGLVISVLENLNTLSVWGWWEVDLVISVLEDFAADVREVQ